MGSSAAVIQSAVIQPAVRSDLADEGGFKFKSGRRVLGRDAKLTSMWQIFYWCSDNLCDAVAVWAKVAKKVVEEKKQDVVLRSKHDVLIACFFFLLRPLAFCLAM